jgi:NAD(P)-dependent dehydrogenase (short-subunit alcohol dehydrogenase family)
VSGQARPFAGQVAIITGGASGIGRAMGESLFRQGANVILGDLGPDTASDVARLISAGGSPGGGSIDGAELDVRDRAAVGALVESVAATHRRLDLMFNNAGVSSGGPTHEMHASHWDRVIDVNLNGVVNGVLAAYPLMIAQGRGHIVNTASGAGLAPMPMTVPYTATKYAVVGLSTALRPEAARLGVRISALCPGAVDTPILDRSSPEGLPPMPAGTPTGREFLRRIGTRPMAPAPFASAALRGVARNQRIIAVPYSTKALWYLHRISPGATERLSRMIVRRATG